MSNHIGATIARFCLGQRLLVLTALTCITATAVVALPRAYFDNALEIWFLDDDPALMAHRKLLDTFGSDDLIIVGVEAPDVFSPEALRAVDRMTRKIEAAPHVEKVFSLTNIESISGDGETLNIGELIEFPLDPGSLPAIREKALANDLYVNNVVSSDGTFACIVARLPHYSGEFEYKVEAVTAIRAIIDSESGVRTFLSGGPVVDDAFFSISQRDSKITISLMIGLLIITLALLLRSVVGVMVPLATVVLATVWAMGWIALAGVPLNVITTMLPPLILAVGVADSMHVLVEYRNRYRLGTDKNEVLVTVYADLMTPLFLTSLTTAVGMLSLCISRVQGIRQFGLFAALGVVGAFVLSISFVLVVLSYLPPPKPWPRRTASRGLSADTLRRIHTVTMQHGGAIAVGFALLVVAGIAAATQVRAESAFLEMFHDGERVKVDTRHIEDVLAGTVTVDVIADSGTADGIKNPEFLAKVTKLQAFLESQDIISSSQSVADYFKDMRRAFFDNDQSQYRLPTTRNEAAQYLLLYEMDAPDGDIKEYATFDYRQARVSARVDIKSSNALSSLIDTLQEYTKREFRPPFGATVSGLALLYADMENYIRDSLVRSFGIALIAMFVVLCLLMRSVVLGIIAMIPNVIPIIACLGVMGATGIRLDSMTAMVASIAIGLAVDDSIHFVTRVRKNLSAGHAMPQALEEATVNIGRALVYTSLTLAAGFGIMTVAEFVGTVHFGLLCVITIVFALISDLLLLPVILRWHDDHKSRVTLESHSRINPGRPSIL